LYYILLKVDGKVEAMLEKYINMLPVSELGTGSFLYNKGTI